MFEYGFKVLSVATSYGAAKSMVGYWAKYGELTLFWGRHSPGVVNIFIFETTGVTLASMADPFKWFEDLAKYLRDHFDIGDVMAERDKYRDHASRLREDLNKKTREYEFYCGKVE